MAAPRTILSTALFCLWWPTRTLLSLLALILSPIWAILHFLFLPASHLIRAIYAVLSLPVRLHILDRIETIYIWVGVAGLIGCIAGAGVFFVFRFITAALNIDGAAEAQRKEEGRTLEEFRAARRVKKKPHRSSPSGPHVDKVAALRRRGLATQPILEEESES